VLLRKNEVKMKITNNCISPNLFLSKSSFCANLNIQPKKNKKTNENPCEFEQKENDIVVLKDDFDKLLKKLAKKQKDKK